MQTDPYALFLPAARTTSVVFSSPHSGRDYPWAFLRQTVLDERAVRSSEDAFVDQLFADAPQMGAPLLAARMPRAYVDLNRAAEELDPAVIEGVSAVGHNPRVSSGLGVIPRVVANGRVIYRGKLPRAEAEARLDGYWRPYHACLQRLLDEANAAFGEAILIDCHSMPHEAIESVSGGGKATPHVVLGDRFGASAEPDVVDRIEVAFRNAGLRVGRNTPFAGAHITQRYGRPSRGQHAIQVEIDRALYMDEAEIRPSRDYRAFKSVLSSVIAEIAEIGRGLEMPLAAE
ncbi:N-formylglutamate amidohydrolase [Rhodovulum iodosum]|uniref:N-formylglutamate amidohydrolase n=1 Tax=Rhodovulum iodosum TaxID=68291 RepID=A0ABV3XQS6_9RHOB|nr:N-formylglutamate amidohydrolase [Rhodovulum robiginosum]RSK32898.1 N-formylglutamate amidohydrolase [Rhodovulum robiginosum]